MKVSVTNEHEKLLNHVHCLFSHIKLKVFVMNGMGGWKRKLCQLILVFNLILLLVQWFGIQYTYQLISKFHFFRSTKLEYIRIYFEKLLFDSDIYLWFDLKWKVVNFLYTHTEILVRTAGAFQKNNCCIVESYSIFVILTKRQKMKSLKPLTSHQSLNLITLLSLDKK